MYIYLTIRYAQEFSLFTVHRFLKVREILTYSTVHLHLLLTYLLTLNSSLLVDNIVLSYQFLS